MEAKLVAMLEPLAGRDNVRATVNVSYDQGSEERTDEVYDPSQVATLTMQKSEQMSAPRGSASGVPGTASNSPGALQGCCGRVAGGGCARNATAVAEGGFAGLSAAGRGTGTEHERRERDLRRDKTSGPYRAGPGTNEACVGGGGGE